MDRRPRRRALPRRRVQRTRHPGEPPPRAGRTDLRPAPARLERRTGHARRAVRGLRGGRPAEAARLVALDGTVSHEGEGIYGGQAVAAGVAAAMVGEGTDAVVAAALSVVPEDSWTARSLRRAVVAPRSAPGSTTDASPADAGAGRAFGRRHRRLPVDGPGARGGRARLRRIRPRPRGDFTDSVLTAVNMGRDADTTAAVAGALAGALGGASCVPERWAAAIGPGTGQLPAVDGGLPRAGHRRVAHAGRRRAGRPMSSRETAGEVPAAREDAGADDGAEQPHRPGDPRRIEGLLLGIAAGDAAGWPAARHRASRMPEWTQTADARTGHLRRAATRPPPCRCPSRSTSRRNHCGWARPTTPSGPLSRPDPCSPRRGRSSATSGATAGCGPRSTSRGTSWRARSRPRP